MEQTTYLADCIDSTEYESQYDNQAKNLTASKQVLAWILKNTVEELMEYDLETIENCIEGTPEISVKPVMPHTKEKITGNNTESTIMGEGTRRFDIRFYVILPNIKEKVKILMNIELQKKYTLKYDLVTRGILYGARMLSEQSETEFSGDNYQDIKKVYSIWVCMNAPSRIANTISGYTITRDELYGEMDEDEYYDLLAVILIRLPEEECEIANTKEKYTAKEDKVETVKVQHKKDRKALIDMLTVLYSHTMSAKEKKKILKEEYGLRMTRKLEGGIDTMCNLSQGVKEAGIHIGLQQGIQQGLQQGLQQGQQQSKRFLNEILMDALGMLGNLPKELTSYIQKEDNLETLKQWIFTAHRAASLEQFMSNMN